MVNAVRFRLKKDGEPYSDCYCRHPELIENYDKAISDTTQTWDIHHRLECCFTKTVMEEMNLYYDVEPEALIFLTRAEHVKIDSYRKRSGLARKGRKCSDDTRKKLSESHKGKNRKDLSKKVLCVETGETFESVMDAYRKTGVGFRNISMVCHGKRKTTGGFHWRFV